MLKIAVCDDDHCILELMSKMIRNYEKKECLVSVFSDGESLISCSEKFDIIFLDIDMGKLNGIETARIIRKNDKQVKIVYVTSYRDYVSYAFGVHAFGYVLKPLDKEKIYHQIDEAVDYLLEEENLELLEFVTEDGVVHLSSRDICYFEYQNRRVFMTAFQKTYVIKGKITDIASHMEPYGFYMPHKSFSVNLYFVKNIKGYNIFMTDGSAIPLSQKKSVMFREKLNEFLVNHI